jgi:hypothetical protein
MLSSQNIDPVEPALTQIPLADSDGNTLFQPLTGLCSEPIYATPNEDDVEEDEDEPEDEEDDLDDEEEDEEDEDDYEDDDDEEDADDDVVIEDDDAEEEDAEEEEGEVEDEDDAEDDPDSVKKLMVSTLRPSQHFPAAGRR